MQQVKYFSNDNRHNGLSVGTGDTLREALDVFRANPSMRMLAVVDSNSQPLGVICEVDVRDLLFNPFGHALMQNPGFGKDIKNLIRYCAVAEHHLDGAQLIAAYSASSGSPGLLLTKNGKFLETLSDDQLLLLMSQARITRAERITECSQAFTEEILTLSGQLSEAANRISALSESLGQQANGMTDAAQNVASGAAQSSLGLQDIKERGRQLANALEQLTVVASEAKTVRSKTHDVLGAAEPQMKALATSGSEIGNIIDVINNVGRQTNFLALNAQIEAAREDVNTNGFVAVAGEIKQLASQTRGRADEISKKVAGIGKVVDDVLSGHDEIVMALERMSSISDIIGVAVDEQSATSLVIAGFVEQAADATSDISAQATDIGLRAHHVQTGSRELERVSAMLQKSAAGIGERSRSFVQSIQYA